MNDRESRRADFDNMVANMNASMARLQCKNCKTLGAELIDIMKIAFEKEEKIQELTKGLELARKLLRDKEIDAITEENRIMKGYIKAQDERNLRATNRVGMPPFDCDTPEQLAEEIIELRAEIEKLRASKLTP